MTTPARSSSSRSSSFAGRSFCLLGRRVQDLLLFWFLGAFRLTARIILFHILDFIGRKLWQMADEKHQMPALMVVGPAFAPRRHARKTHAILYDVIQLAIGELLSFRQAHVRSPGIQFSAHLRPAAAGIAVTARAMLGKVSASLDKKLRAHRW